ncbi:hypothetical protein N665_0011s0007 [Sinapis alba]|nr:hypothetical protein N665_0011s0007 [Sinapis alba]
MILFVFRSILIIEDEKLRGLVSLSKHSGKSVSNDVEQRKQREYNGSLDASAGPSSPSMRMATRTPQSPRVFGVSDSLSFNQALRDRCVSRASETAALKRLSTSAAASPRVSEADRIKSLYNQKGKGSLVETSLMPVNDKPSTSKSVPQRSEEASNTISEPTQAEIKPLHKSNKSGSCLSSGSGDYEIELDENVVSPSAQAFVEDDVKEIDKHVTSLPSDSSNRDNATEHEKKILSSTLDLEQKGNFDNNTATSRIEKSNTVRKVARMTPRPKQKPKKKILLKKKLKIGIVSVSNAPKKNEETEISLDSTASKLLCQRCHYSLKSTSIDNKPLSYTTSHNPPETLGCGDIRTVYLSELIGTNCLFAVKVMDNEFLARRKKSPRTQAERDVLKMLDHPFLPTLQKQLGRCFPKPAARDLKPENILVREDGHIMLTDFDLSLRCAVNPTLLRSTSPPRNDPARTSGPYNTSNCIQPFCIMEPSCQQHLKRSLPQLVAEPTEARSNSFVGTHEYLAPEIIRGEGHGAAVDWWTFGVLLYELLYGKTPFKRYNNDETLANVVLQNLNFPDSPLVIFQAKDLIRELLVKEPENWLGSEKGSADIKRHPFFEGLNWALIRCAIPPELPDFYEFGGGQEAAGSLEGNDNMYLECKAIGDHLEFECSNKGSCKIEKFFW